MSDILREYSKLNRVDRHGLVRTMINVIKTERNWSLDEIGRALSPSVKQPTVTHWFSGYSLPAEAHFNQLVDFFFGPWIYVCSFHRKDYSGLLQVEARRALFEARQKSALSVPAPLNGTPSVHIDLHIRPAMLCPGALAHTFSNHDTNPSIFVVLVSAKEPFHRQYQIAWEEINAHVVARELIDPGALPIAESITQHGSEEAPKVSGTSSWRHNVEHKQA